MKNGIMHVIGVLALCVGLLLAMPTAAWAGGYTVYVPAPNGVDDTANLQRALDDCVRIGQDCTVQLAGGRYLTKQLVAYSFHGTFRGQSQSKTIVEALPNLPVNSWDHDNTTWWPPNTTDHTWPDLIMFVDGDIRVSDMTIKTTSIPATQPYYLFGGIEFRQFLGAIRIMGQYRTQASIERVSFEGRRDETSVAGFNLINALYWVGDLPKSLTFHDAYPLVGTLTVSSSSFNLNNAQI